MWRALRRAVIVLVIAALVITVVLVIAQDQETIQIKSDISAEDPRDPAYVAALVGADLTRGNSFDVLTNGDQILPAMLEAIDRATKRVSFETYVWTSGTVAERFTAALERAARRGVRVTVVVDAIGAATMAREESERLEQAGARVLTFNPTRWYTPESLNFRTHRKILVVDGQVGFTGGVGVSDHWLGNARSKEEWRDTQVRMRGPIVRLLEAAFYENAIGSHGPTTPELDDEPEWYDATGPALLVSSSSSGGSTDLERLYLQAIASARRTVDLATPYFVTDSSSMWALEDAARRGVKIRVLVEGDITDAMPVKYASRAAYDRLLGVGLQLFEYQPTMMHAKAMMVDGVLSVFGSANFDNRSLELNDELNIAVWNRELAARFLADFEQDLRVSRRLDLESWRHRSLLQKSREVFWSSFGEVF
jgi:cardiolipin synthase A/B